MLILIRNRYIYILLISHIHLDLDECFLQGYILKYQRVKNC